MSTSVDQGILQHMIDTQAEFIMEVTDKTKSDIKVGLSEHVHLSLADRQKL